MLPPWRGGWTLVFTLSFVFSMLLGDQSFGPQLQVDSSVGIAARWWAPLTSPFSLSDGALGYLGVHFVVQWFLGGRLEGFWGTRRYLLFCLCTGVSGGLLAALTLAPLGAATGASSMQVGGPLAIDAALLLAFARVFGKENYSLPGMAGPLSGRAICGFAALLVLGYFLIPRPIWAAYVPVVGAAVVGALFVWQPWRRSPKSGKVGGAKKVSHLRVVRTPDDLLN